MFNEEFYDAIHFKIFITAHRLTNLYARLSDSWVSPGISSRQYSILLAMKLNGPKATAATICKFLNQKPNSLSGLLERMEKYGLITRTQRGHDLTDRRASNLSITSKGDALFQNVEIQNNSFLDNFLGKLADAEKLALYTMMDKLVNQMAAELGETVT